MAWAPKHHADRFCRSPVDGSQVYKIPYNLQRTLIGLRMIPLDILVEDDLDVGYPYILDPLMQVWQSAGRRVSIRGPGQPQTADLALLHVNRSVVPGRIASLAQEYALCLNAGALDLSKRAVSTRLVDPDDSYNGPVIVKTNANAGGAPDARKDKRYGGKTGARRALEELRRLIPWQLARRLPHNEYPIFPNKEEVPTWIWKRTDLVVEQLALERSEHGYVARRWTFLGAAEWCSICHSTSPIVKRDNTVKLERSDFIPEGARLVRERLKCDFGKIDWVLTEEGPIVFDVNQTPTFSTMNDTLLMMVDILAAGLPGESTR
jgi:hypothetical protein